MGTNMLLKIESSGFRGLLQSELIANDRLLGFLLKKSLPLQVQYIVIGICWSKIFVFSSHSPVGQRRRKPESGHSLNVYILGISILCIVLSQLSAVGIKCVILHERLTMAIVLFNYLEIYTQQNSNHLKSNYPDRQLSVSHHEIKI